LENKEPRNTLTNNAKIIAVEEVDDNQIDGILNQKELTRLET
jgi:hypothetical protein